MSDGYTEVACPTCKAQPGIPCRQALTNTAGPHDKRRIAWEQEPLAPKAPPDSSSVEALEERAFSRGDP